MKLGLSETVAVKGNVDSFEVANNKVHHNNSIGIVLIGHEGVSPVAALDPARNGIVRNLLEDLYFYLAPFPSPLKQGRIKSVSFNLN